MPPELFLLFPSDPEGAQALFETLKVRLQSVLAAGADIQHVGATAIPGCLTKGDVDCCIRVKQEDFTTCDAALAVHFPRNTGPDRTNSFSAFYAEDAGIQLVAIGSPLDFFTAFRDLLRDRPDLVARYNQLKLLHHGKPMHQYRKAKDDFIQYALASV
ncbi:MAG: GrpB family protein [Candidatus Binatus sp.]